MMSSGIPLWSDGLAGDGLAGDARRARYSTLMLLADGRFPSGGHAYSAGMEQAITWGDVRDLAGAEEFLAGRVETLGPMAAQVAAAGNVAAHGAAKAVAPAGRQSGRTLGEDLDLLDEAVDARLASASARSVSREQGHRWLRAVRAAWPAWVPSASYVVLDGRHGWVVLGAVGAAVGLVPSDVARVALYDLVSAPLWAAVRLLGLDPFAALEVLVGVLARADPLASSSAAAAANGAAGTGGTGGTGGTEWISWLAAPLSELAAEAHLQREERLFAS